MTNTAAGPINVTYTAMSPKRGQTRMWFGTDDSGRFVVASRFQIEQAPTHDRAKALGVFQRLIIP